MVAVVIPNRPHRSMLDVASWILLHVYTAYGAKANANATFGVILSEIKKGGVQR